MRTSAFKNELTKAQDLQAATLTKETERQTNYLEKMRTETRHEIDKLVASQRLDMNLEKGRIRDDLQGMRDKVTELEIKVGSTIIQPISQSHLTPSPLCFCPRWTMTSTT